MTHICVSKLTIIGSDNGLSPRRRQAIIWTNAGILLIWTLGTNFSEIIGEIDPFSFCEMHLKMSSGKWRLFGLGLNELTSKYKWNESLSFTKKYSNYPCSFTAAKCRQIYMQTLRIWDAVKMCLCAIVCSSQRQYKEMWKTILWHHSFKMLIPCMKIIYVVSFHRLIMSKEQKNACAVESH